MAKVDLGKVVGEVNPKTQIPYELAESYQVPMSGDPMDIFMGKVTTDLRIHDSAIGRSDAYSDEVDYAANEYCIKDNMVYRFTEDKPMGPWDETKAVATNIITELLDMRRSLIELNSKAMDKAHKSWDSITTRLNEGYIQLDISDLTAHISSFEFSVITYWGGCVNADGHQPFSLVGSGTNFYFISRPNTTITSLNVDFWYYIKNRK